VTTVDWPQMRWRSLTSLSVNLDRITIENPLYGSRLSVSVDGLVEMLLGPYCGTSDSALAKALEERGLLRPPSEQSTPDKAMDDWVRNGWQRSLEYFLWSERAEFADWHDTDDSVRNAVIVRTQRQESSAPPERRAVPSDQAVSMTPQPMSRVPVGELLLGRRTHRYFDPTPMPLSELASVLSVGLHSVRSARARARHVGGEEGILETHGVAFDFHIMSYGIEGLESGVWALDLDQLALGRVADGDIRQRMSEIMCGMPAPLTAAATIVFVADFRQLQHRYRHERALRSLYVEAGQIAQLLILAAESIGYGCLITPATNDRQLAQLLRLPGERYAPAYTVTIGRKVKKTGKRVADGPAGPR
jgi:nitroreductase